MADLMDLRAAEAQETVRRAFAAGRVETDVCGSKEYVLRNLIGDTAKADRGLLWLDFTGSLLSDLWTDGGAATGKTNAKAKEKARAKRKSEKALKAKIRRRK